MNNYEINKNLEKEFRQIIKDLGIKVEDDVFLFFRKKKNSLELAVHQSFEEFAREYPEKRSLILLFEVLTFWAGRNFTGFGPRFDVPGGFSFELYVRFASKNPFEWYLMLDKDQIKALLKEISLYKEWYILDPSYPSSNVSKTTKRIFLYLWSLFLFPKALESNPIYALHLLPIHEFRRFPVVSIAIWDIAKTQKPFLARYLLSNLKEMLIWTQSFLDFSTDYQYQISTLKYLPVCDHYLSTLPPGSGKVRTDLDYEKLHILIGLLEKYIENPEKSKEAVYIIIQGVDIEDYYKTPTVSRFLYGRSKECRYIIDEIAKLTLINYDQDKKLFYKLAEKVFSSGTNPDFAYTPQKLKIGESKVNKEIQKNQLKVVNVH